jgi:hypothetical protein
LSGKKIVKVNEPPISSKSQPFNIKNQQFHPSLLTHEKQFNKYNNSKKITANGYAHMSQHEMWNNTMTQTNFGK